MSVVIKLFLTYAATSMFCGLCLILLTAGDIISYKAVPVSIVTILWLGPAMLGLSICGPILLWKLWRLK